MGDLVGECVQVAREPYQVAILPFVSAASIPPGGTQAAGKVEAKEHPRRGQEKAVMRSALCHQ